MSVRLSAVATVVAAALTTSSAWAAEPTQEQCVEANEKAQALRQQESLQAARAELAFCLASSCPGPVRQDCADRIAEIDRAIPTLVFEVTDADGHDVPGVALRVDGKPLAASLDGAAVAIDPGSHELTFVPRGGPEVTRTLVVREGEKGRHVVVKADGASGLAAPDDADPGRTQRLAGIVVGGAGVAGIVLGSVLGIVAKSTYDAAVKDHCKGNASTCSPEGLSQIQTAHGQATASTVSFIVGGALVAGGVTLWLTARRAVRVAPTAHGATLVLGGSF